MLCPALTADLLPSLPCPALPALPWLSTCLLPSFPPVPCLPSAALCWPTCREVDHVITTKELAQMCQQAGIDFASLPGEPCWLRCWLHRTACCTALPVPPILAASACLPSCCRPYAAASACWPSFLRAPSYLISVPPPAARCSALICPSALPSLCPHFALALRSCTPSPCVARRRGV